MSTNLSKLADELKPYFVPWVRKIAHGNGGGTGTGGTPDMLAHELATASALGAYHTVSGLTSGHVLKATGATTAAFGQLSHASLSDLLTGDPHTQYALRVRSITSGNGLTGGGDLSLDRTLAVGVSGLGLSVGADAVTLTSSSSPGAAASILASDASGFLTLQKLTTPILSAAATLSIEPAGTLYLDSAVNTITVQPSNNFSTDHYVSQLTGWAVRYDGTADFRYLYTTELHAKSFIADMEQALAGGQIISKSVAVMAYGIYAPAAGASESIYLEDLPTAPDMPVFVSGDIVRLRVFTRVAGELQIADCWGVVSAFTADTGPGGTEGGVQRWLFTRSSAPNAGAMTAGTVIPKGQLALDYGTTGMGFYEVNAIDGAYGANSPYAQVVTWATHPATGQTLRVRMGNLQGVTGTNEYGFWAGAPTLGNVLVTGGKVAMRQGTTEVITLAADGTSYFAGAMSLGTSGGIYQGSGSFASPTTGLKLWNSSGIGRLTGYLSGVEQAGFNSSGQITAGAGTVTLDAYGITVAAGTSWTRNNAYGFTNGGGWWAGLASNTAGSLTLYADYTGSVNPFIYVQANGNTSFPGTITLEAIGADNNSLTVTPTLITLGGDSKVSGTLLVEANNPTIDIGNATMSTGTAGLNLGAGRTGNGYAGITLYGAAGGYGAQLARGNTGANAYTEFSHTGTGELRFITVNAGHFILSTNSTERLRIQSDGLAKFTSSVAVGGDYGGTASYVTHTSTTQGVSTGSGTIKMNGFTGRNSTGWLKVYIGTGTVWIPYFDTITG